ncbi:hypothetical protein N9T54_04240 [Alphaproteobacteria bacterium]|nr:hypothetical protein [Alphaproteobacteria bacterium]
MQLARHSSGRTCIPNSCQTRPVWLRLNHLYQLRCECIDCLFGGLPAICGLSCACRA